MHTLSETQAHRRDTKAHMKTHRRTHAHALTRTCALTSAPRAKSSFTTCNRPCSIVFIKERESVFARRGGKEGGREGRREGETPTAPFSA